MSHTPGPWSIWTSCSWRRIGNEVGLLVCEPVVQRSDGHPDLYFRNGGVDGPDARLIASAPELLAALEWYVNNDAGQFHYLDNGIGVSLPEGKARLAARAAIKKARGEA